MTVPLLLLLLTAGPDELSPQLRHINYVAFLPGAEPVTLHLASVRHSSRYAEGLNWLAVVGDGLVVGRGLLGLEESADVDLGELPARLHAVKLDSGWNLARAGVSGAPWAVVCHETLQVSLVGEARWFVFQPADREAIVSVGASVTREGCRVMITLPDGAVAVDETDDFDQPRTFRLAASARSRVLELAILKPDTAELVLDDVELVLKDGLAPYLAPTAAFAQTLGERWLQWSSRH